MKVTVLSRLLKIKTILKNKKARKKQIEENFLRTTNEFIQKIQLKIAYES